MTHDIAGWTPSIRKGHEFLGPDGQGYRVMRDVYPADPITVGTLDPFGGAPECKAGDAFPRWLAVQLSPPRPE